jgi:hypothetical protein
MSNHGKTFGIKGFAKGFGEAFDVRGFAVGFRSTFDLREAARGFTQGFRDGADLVAGHVRQAVAALRRGARRQDVVKGHLLLQRPLADLGNGGAAVTALHGDFAEHAARPEDLAALAARLVTEAQKGMAKLISAEAAQLLGAALEREQVRHRGALLAECSQIVLTFILLILFAGIITYGCWETTQILGDPALSPAEKREEMHIVQDWLGIALWPIAALLGTAVVFFYLERRPRQLLGTARERRESSPQSQASDPVT